MLSLLLIPPLMAALVVAPGIRALRRLDIRPLERLCLSIALSLLLMASGAGAIYLLQLPPVAWQLLAVLLLLVGVAGKSDLRALASSPEVRPLVAPFVLLVLFVLSLLALVRNYAGGDWVGDWREHYERALFFVRALPVETLFLGASSMPSRPPLANAAVAVVLAQVGDGFAAFQVTSALLSLLVFWPVCLLAVRAGLPPAVAGWIGAALLAGNAMAVQNALYPWTKLPAAFFVLTGAALYVQGLREEGSGRTEASFACLAAGSLAHYSSAPYLLFFGFHHLARVVRGRADPRQLARVVLIGLLLMGPWVLWALSTYGAAVTFASNTSVTDARKLTLAQNVTKVAQNLLNTLVPHVLRDADQRHIDQPSAIGYVKDSLFLIYQDTFPFSLGSVGWVLLALDPLLFPRGSREERRLWLGLLVFAYVVGITTVGSLQTFGVAHVCLQPMTLAGIALLAARLPRLPPILRLVALGGLVLDLAFGVLLPRFFDHKAFTMIPQGPGRWRPDASDGLGPMTYFNWKLKLALDLDFLGDLFAGSPELPIAVAVVAGLVLAAALGYNATRGYASSSR